MRTAHTVFRSLALIKTRYFSLPHLRIPCKQNDYLIHTLPQLHNTEFQHCARIGSYAQTLSSCLTCPICVFQSLMTRASITPAHGCMAKHVSATRATDFQPPELFSSRFLTPASSSPSYRRPPCRNGTSPVCMLMPACRDEPPARARMRSFHVRKLSVSGGAK